MGLKATDMQEDRSEGLPDSEQSFGNRKLADNESKRQQDCFLPDEEDIEGLIRVQMENVWMVVGMLFREVPVEVL